MDASTLMTRSVVTVQPETTVHEIAALLVERRISGVPVVSGKALVGIVTEGDLVRRHEIGTDRFARGSPWWRRLVHADRVAGDYVKSHARCASDVMTPRVVTVEPDTPVARIVERFARHRIRRVPVLEGRVVVGIVSRSDIVRAVASRASSREVPSRADDEWILAQLVAELSRQPWWRDDASVTVCRGTVHYWGFFHADDERAAARVAAQNTPGVQAIRDHRIHVSACSPLM